MLMPSSRRLMWDGCRQTHRMGRDEAIMRLQSLATVTVCLLVHLDRSSDCTRLQSMRALCMARGTDQGMIYRTPQLNQSSIIIAVLDFKPDRVVSNSSVCIMTDAVPVIRPRGARTPALVRHVGCSPPGELGQPLKASSPKARRGPLRMCPPIPVQGDRPTGPRGRGGLLGL